MKQKLGGKSFNIASSALPYQKPPPALPSNKQSKEFVLTMIFSHFLLYNGIRITKLEVNEDDSHGKPDTKIVANGIEQGIQLTKISLNDPLRRINVAERQTDELLNLFSDNIEISSPINIYIYLNSKNKNSIPKGNLKKKKKLVDLISKGITNNKDKIFGNNPEIVFLPREDSELKNLANSITINPVNTGDFSTFQGKRGIHINYEFDTHDWDEEDLDEEITRIIESKKGGNEDILLIWADRFELLYQDDKVADVLRNKFYKTEFKEVFFLTLFDRVDRFLDSWKVVKIKSRTEPNTQ